MNKIERSQHNTPERNEQVFNPEANTSASLTLHFNSAEDAAWIHEAIVALKRDGRLGELVKGILLSSLAATVKWNATFFHGVPMTPQDMYRARLEGFNFGNPSIERPEMEQ